MIEYLNGDDLPPGTALSAEQEQEKQDSVPGACLVASDGGQGAGIRSHFLRHQMLPPTHVDPTAALDLSFMQQLDSAYISPACLPCLLLGPYALALVVSAL